MFQGIVEAGKTRDGEQDIEMDRDGFFLDE